MTKITFFYNQSQHYSHLDLFQSKMFQAFFRYCYRGEADYIFFGKSALQPFEPLFDIHDRRLAALIIKSEFRRQ